MALSHSPQIVTRNLLLNLDFGNIRKCYNGSENLLIYSEQFDNASWTKTNIGITTNTTATTAPDGTNTAEKLAGTNGATTRQSVYQNYSFTAGTKYTVSIFAKQAERRYFSFWFDSPNISEGAYYGAGSIVDLQTGTLTAGSTQTITISSVGNGWYRCSVSATPTVSGSFALSFAIGEPNNSPPYNATGDGTSGIYLWGAQLEKGVASSPYVATVASTVTRPTTATSTVSNYSHTINQPQYISYDAVTNSIRFDRNETFVNFTGSISGTVLTVSAVSSGTFTTGMALSYSGITPPITISSFGTGTGGVGTYNLSTSGGTVTSRAMTAAYKIGGNMNVTASGSLASNTYLYNDHTTEVWARINDRTAASYDGYEGESILVTYAGYHTMFLYGASYLRYYIYDNTGPTAKWTTDLSLGTSATDIIQGQWFNVSVTKSGSTFKTYLNGVLKKTDTITSTAFSGVSNALRLGAAGDGNTGAFYFYAKNNMGCLKMYNTALSAEEIKQNYNALKGRFGLT
jgi:hypothetical protein